METRSLIPLTSYDDMKRRHEAKALSDYVIGDPLAKRVAILLGGVTIGTQLAAIVHGVGSVAKTIAQSLASPESGENSFRQDLIGSLRYAPKGVLRYSLSRATQTRVGLFFVGIFKDAGWRVERISDESLAQAERTSKPSAVLFFMMKDHYIKFRMLGKQSARFSARRVSQLCPRQTNSRQSARRMASCF